MVVLVVLLVGAGAAVALVAPGTTPRGHPHHSPRRSGDVRHSTDPPRAEAVTSVLPAGGTTGVAPDTTIAVTFSDPLAAGSPDPSLSPAVTGTWQVVGSSELLFTPEASFVPSTTYTVRVPGGSSGVRARSGSALAEDVASSFTIAPGSPLRLQQLLAKLGYLPLTFSGLTPVPAGMAIAQPGSFVWRDRGFPSSYTSQWSPTQVTALTKGAVMAFETQNGLEVDDTVGPALWETLLADVAAGKKDTEPVTYVLVTKSLPQHLTVWVNGVLTFAHVPCNTGVPGAPTTDGTFEVFEHVAVSNMRGTDVTGTSYDVTVAWASYFHSGEALHGYPRAAYGFPQSNGCVEMPISTAGLVWPDTPIGTVVTVVGPTA
jgi:lipoprotein-anchoring transpeptidase ErfK/SrfK